MGKTRFFAYIKGFWNFIFYDNSWQSWIVSLVLAFILIKFVLYPGLGFILGTGYPVVAVVSESMDHNIVKSSYFNFDGQKFARISVCGKEFQDEKILTFDKYWSYCGGWYEENIDLNSASFKAI